MHFCANAFLLATIMLSAEEWKKVGKDNYLLVTTQGMNAGQLC